MSARIKAQTRSVSTLTDAVIREMYQVYERYYVHTDFNSFQQDLNRKTDVIIFSHVDRLVGFTTIEYRPQPDIARGYFLFSGDTVMEAEYWGSKILQQAFFLFVARAKLSAPWRPLYWMLISKGYKTYKLLCNHLGHSFPRHDCPTPPHMQAVMDLYYGKKFGNAYSASQGIISYEHPSAAVAGEVAQPREADLKDFDVRHFLQLNPQYSQGVELACVGQVRNRDVGAFALKRLRKWIRA